MYRLTKLVLRSVLARVLLTGFIIVVLSKYGVDLKVENHTCNAYCTDTGQV